MVKAEGAHRHPTILHGDPFRLEPSALFTKALRPRRYANPSVGPKHTVPGKVETVGCIAEHPANKAGAPRVAGACSDGAIAGDAAAGNRRHRFDDPRRTERAGLIIVEFIRHGRFVHVWKRQGAYHRPSPVTDLPTAMRHFEAIRSHVGGVHKLRQNEPYVISFDLELPDGRHQGIYLAELEDSEGLRFLRLSTPIGPLAGVDARRCLRFNWEQRTGYLAEADLDGSPYLHLCENRPYDYLDERELTRLIEELGATGDELEQVVNGEADAL